MVDATLAGDVIVISGWTWEAANVPERLALAFSALGKRVLYCDGPVSRFRQPASDIAEIAPLVFRYRPSFLSHRLNSVPGGAALQSRWVAEQIHTAAGKLKLDAPLVVFPYMGPMLGICIELKRRGLQLVHVCMDHPQPALRQHVSIAASSLIIPKTPFDQLRPDFGDKIIRLPQLGLYPDQEDESVAEPPVLAGIGRPRLIYSGAIQPRIDTGLLTAFLRGTPESQFIYFGSEPVIPVANAHALAWLPQAELRQVVRSCDVGFMPYDCRNEHALHSVPLKLLDYFALGMPVVSTPIISLQDLDGLVYLGDTASDLVQQAARALAEPRGSDKRAQRREIARQHSIPNVATSLARDLGAALRLQTN